MPRTSFLPEVDPLDDLFDAPPVAPRRRTAAGSSLAAPAPRARPAQDWRRLADFSQQAGFTVTSTTGGRHNPGSLHPAGLAIDVRTKDKTPEEVAAFIERAKTVGIDVRDEQQRPAGQTEWTGPHLHLEATTRPRQVVDADPLADLFDTPAPEDEEVVKIEAQAPDLWAAPPAPPAPRPRAVPSINTAEGQAIRDRNLEIEQAPDARRTMSVALPQGLGDWSEASSADVAKQAARQFAAERGIDPQFTEEWLSTRGGDLHIYDRANGQAVQPVDLLATEHYDPEARTIRVSQELPILKRLEADYKNSANVVQGVVDWAADPTRAAGEKFLDVAQPVAGAVARGVDLASRPLSAVDAAAWSMLRNGAAVGTPVIGAADIYAAGQALQGEQVPEYAKNPFGEAVRDSETLASVNPNLPRIIGAGAEMLTSPSNLIPVAAAKAAIPVFRGTRAGARIGGAINAASDARFAKAGKVLDIEAAAPKPRLRMASAEGVTGEGLEVGRQTRRIFSDGKPQPYVMNERGSVVRAPLPPRRPIPAARAGEAGFVDVGEIAKGIKQVATKENAADVLNAPKSLVGSADLSAPLRQGGILTVGEPTAAVRASRDMLRSFVSSKAYENVKGAIAAHPEASLAERSGLYLASRFEPKTLPNGVRVTPKLAAREERFMSSIAGKLPWVKNSERAYVAYLDKLRMDTFAKYADEIRGSGLTPEQTDKALRDIARFVNHATGRGDLPQFLNSAAPVLNGAMFSPRLVASRFQVLNPVRYARMEPAARKIALRKMFQFGGTVASTLALAKYAGADVTLDPTSADFLKIKLGNTRIDVLAGLQQPIRFMYQLGEGVKRNVTGEDEWEPEPWNAQPSDTLTRFLRSKLSPTGSYVADALTGKTFAGEDFEPLGHLTDEQGKFNPGGGVVERVLPMMARDIVEAAQEEGWAGVAKTAPAFLGVGTSTYKEKRDDAGRTTAQRREATQPIVDAVRSAAVDLDSFKALNAEQRKEAIEGLRGYARQIEDSNLSTEQVRHNVRVKLEAYGLRNRIDADNTLSKEQKQKVYSALSRRLSVSLFKKDDDRDFDEVTTDFEFELSDALVDLPDLVKEARQQQK